MPCCICRLPLSWHYGFFVLSFLFEFDSVVRCSNYICLNRLLAFSALYRNAPCLLAPVARFLIMLYLSTCNVPQNLPLVSYGGSNANRNAALRMFFTRSNPCIGAFALPCTFANASLEYYPNAWVCSLRYKNIDYCHLCSARIFIERRHGRKR